MGTPINIRSLFAANNSDDDEPEWLASHADRDVERAGSISSDDPFDIATATPSKPDLAEDAGHGTTDRATDAAGPSTSKAHVVEDKHAKTAKTESKEGQDAAGTKASAGKAPSSGSKLPSTRVQLKIPASLKCVRLLVELPGDDGAAVDLTGDSGAVGRLSINSDSDSKQLLLDLKGVMYNAMLVPMACTACVVNINQSDAKVEAFCHEFLQLEKNEDFGGGEVLEDGTVDGWGFNDTDHDFINAAGKDAGAVGVLKMKGGKGKQGKALGVSSGKVVKVAAKKKASGGAGAKGKSSKAKAKRK